MTKKSEKVKDSILEDIKIPDEIREVEVTRKVQDVKLKKNLYLDFKLRTTFYIILLILCIILNVIFVLDSVSLNDENKLNVSEKSNIDYKVYLKENEFYDEEYLEKDMTYVSNLIKNIDIDFNYFFNIDKAVDCDFTYKVIAKVLITDPDSGQKFFQKEYLLSENTEDKLEFNKTHKITKNVQVDYEYYNQLANKFKASYGVNADSSLIISLVVDKKVDIKEKEVSLLDKSSTASLTIPLTMKAVNIKLEGQNVNAYGEVIEESSIHINNITFVILSVLSTIAIIIIIINIIKLLLGLKRNKTKYDKYIEKLLKEYDRLIVETTSIPDLEYLDVFKINKFNELLDVRDNLKVPIMYYNVASHNKCYFFIKNGDDIYLLTIKAVDVE